MKKINSAYKGRKISLVKKIKHKIFFLFRLNDYPIIKVYNGYGNHEKIIVIGHVLKVSPMPRKTYRKNWITNLFSIIRLFMVVPISNTKVFLKWESEVFETETEFDGFFRFEVFPVKGPNSGWQSISVHLESNDNLQNDITGHGNIFIPSESQHAFISDIDDTFLISHSSKMRRRLYVLFTKNGRTRRAFEGVIHHYNQLACFGREGNNSNPFFYVSSSEWNLYNFVVEFARFNKLPKGIFLLGQMKRLKDFWRSGQNNHATKLMRIVRVIESYSNLKFVLMGDDSQQDPEIYLSVVTHFPEKIIAVYIRKIHAPNFNKVRLIIDEMEKSGVDCCYFEHSSEAIIHSKTIGLI